MYTYVYVLCCINGPKIFHISGYDYTKILFYQQDICYSYIPPRVGFIVSTRVRGEAEDEC